MENLENPLERLTETEWSALRRYFRLDSDGAYRSKIRQWIYGGRDLTRLIAGVDISLSEVDPLRATLTLVGRHPSHTVVVHEMSMRQFVVSSSWPHPIDPSDPPGWFGVDLQTRVEVCQNELGRWSLILKSGAPVDAWGGRRTPPGINLENHEWCEEIELVNNCTTSEGFELKLRVHEGSDLVMHHGSFVLPQDAYRALCDRQAGAWANQGWDDADGTGLVDPSHPIDPDANPSFGQVYRSPFHWKAALTLDLSRYRTLAETPRAAPLYRTGGRLQYDRWPEVREYIAKPFERRLVMQPGSSPADPGVYSEPPATYEQVQGNSPAFKLPDFTHRGLYQPLRPTEKTHYAQLAGLARAEVALTDEGLYEFALVREDPDAGELHRVLIGNIALGEIPRYPGSETIDRFTFAPRRTTELYDDRWTPLTRRDGRDVRPVYACFLAPPTSGDSRNHGDFIQAESWGVERAVLSRSGDGRYLVIDLISFERIVPVWQGAIDLQEIGTV